jgi:hypothetical protein
MALGPVNSSGKPIGQAQSDHWVKDVDGLAGKTLVNQQFADWHNSFLIFPQRDDQWTLKLGAMKDSSTYFHDAPWAKAPFLVVDGGVDAAIAKAKQIVAGQSDMMLGVGQTKDGQAYLVNLGSQNHTDVLAISNMQGDHTNHPAEGGGPNGTTTMLWGDHDPSIKAVVGLDDSHHVQTQRFDQKPDFWKDLGEPFGVLAGGNPFQL